MDGVLARGENLDSRCVPFRLTLSPLLTSLRRRLQQHSLLVAALVHGETVFIDYAVFEANILSADPTEFRILRYRQHGGARFLQRRIDERITAVRDDHKRCLALYFRPTRIS